MISNDCALVKEPWRVTFWTFRLGVRLGVRLCVRLLVRLCVRLGVRLCVLLGVRLLVRLCVGLSFVRHVQKS